MPGKQLSVVVTRRLPEVVETRMTELFNVRLRDDDIPLSSDQLAEAMQGADVLVSTITDQIDARLLARAGDRLKLIANYGAGVDNIDVATARQRGIHVSNTPGVVTEDTADMVMALILGVTRRLSEGMRLAQSDDWQGWSPTAMLGGRIAGRRLGHPRHGPDRAGGCAPGCGVWHAGALPQSQTPAPRGGRGTRRHLLGQP